MKTAFQKTMSLVLAFIMVFSMLTITASAELTYDGEATLSAVVADGTYELNDTFDVTVVLTGGKFHGIEYALTYDSTALQLYQVYNADEEAFVEANETNVVTAMEVDMAGMPECTLSAGVVSVAWAKSGSAKTFNDAAILTLKFKVIAETGVLTEEEKELVTRATVSAGASFIKTCTGYSGGGATVADIKLIKKVGNEKLQIKASGGIRDCEKAIALIKYGAERIGTSSSIEIIKQFKEKYGEVCTIEEE